MKYLKDYGNCEGPLGFPMQETEARELDGLLETGEWSHFSVQKAELDGVFSNERSEISVISDNTVDKDGEVLDPKSVDFSHFQKNPVVAYNHMYDIPPVGKSLWQKLVGKTTWKAKTQYIDRPSDYPSDSVWFPSSVFHMIKSGSLKGKSVGGAVKWRETSLTEDELKFNPTWKSAKRVSERVIVWEYSVCPLAINNNTLVEDISKSMLHVPDDILQRDFPDVFKMLTTNENKLPVIADFVTVEEYLTERKAFLQYKFDSIQENIPGLIETAFKRLKGEVS